MIESELSTGGEVELPEITETVLLAIELVATGTLDSASAFAFLVPGLNLILMP